MSVSEKLQWAESLTRILTIIQDLEDPKYTKEHAVNDLLKYVEFLEDGEPVIKKS